VTIPAKSFAALPRTLAIAALILLPISPGPSARAAPPPMPPPMTQPPTADDDDRNAATRADPTADAAQLQRQIEGLSASPQPGDQTGPSAGAPDLQGQINQLGEGDAQTQVPDEVVIEVASATSQQAIAVLDRRNRIATIERLPSKLTGTMFLRARILDLRPAPEVAHALASDTGVIAAQPNHLFALQEAGAKTSGEPLQYAVAKLRLAQAHALAKGENVLIGMIDSGVDTAHPELRGAIAGTFDAVGGPGGPQTHGTAIAGLIVAHVRLEGSAPGARILAARAFGSAGVKGSTFNVLKGLDWAATKGARVINMSFAGPVDPAIHRAIEGAYRAGIVLVAAAGNAGPASPPLYPAAEPHVIAVSATDSADRIFTGSNRGRYIALAAPGVDILVASPDGGYQILSGTSFSAAEVSGVAALMIQRRPHLSPDALRGLLTETARPLAPQAGSDGFNPRLIDAYQATSRAAGRPLR
jgi:subtilisin family serine protease